MPTETPGATPSPTLSRKTEQAAVAYIATLGILTDDGAAFANIYSGKASVDKAAPCIIAWAERAKFDDNFSGNAHVTLHIITKYNLADGSVDDSDNLTATVFNGFSLGQAGDNAKVADQLNLQDIADFTAFTNQKLSEEANAEEGEVWVETLTLDIYAGQASGM